MFLSLWLSLPLAILAAEQPVKSPPAETPADCQLILEGKHVERLVLTTSQGLPKTFTRPGASITLPAGDYTISEIELEDHLQAYSRASSYDPSADRITLSPEKPCRPKLGAPLTPSVAVKRAGRLLKVDYLLLDGDGRKYLNTTRTNPPQVAVYQGDTKIASGSFEYG